MGHGRLWIWEEDECRALREALKKLNEAAPKANRICQHHLAAAIGISASSVNAYLNGNRVLNSAFALGVQEVTGIPIRAFSERLAIEIEAAKALPQE
ncbi:hypothetical protein D3C76_1472110 [compost metagenome]